MPGSRRVALNTTLNSDCPCRTRIMRAHQEQSRRRPASPCPLGVKVLSSVRRHQGHCLMSGDFHVGSIVFFAIVVLFLVFRLRGVLGRRTGQERYRDPFAQRSASPPARTPMPGAPAEGRGPVIEGTATPVPEPATLTAGLARLKAADR